MREPTDPTRPTAPTAPAPAGPPGEAATGGGPAGLVVRTAEVAEYPAIGRLTVDAYVAGGHLDGDSDYLRALGDPASRTAGCDLLAATDRTGRLVGSVVFVHPESDQREVAAPDEGEIRMLAVAPDAQGAGVGTALVGACLDRARAAGYRAVALCVIRSNEGAHRLYRRFGFVRTPERDWEPNPVVPLLAYRLALA